MAKRDVHHDLKCWPEYFQQVWDRNKLFEIRKNDRGFTKGDTFTLWEYEPSTQEYTNRFISGNITYVTPFGQPEGQVVFGIYPVKQGHKSFS